MKKRLFALILVLAMGLSILPASAVKASDHSLPRDSLQIQDLAEYCNGTLTFGDWKEYSEDGYFVKGAAYVRNFKGKAADKGVLDSYAAMLADGKHNLKLENQYDFSYKDTFFSWSLNYTGSGAVTSTSKDYDDLFSNVTIIGSIENGALKANVYIPAEMQPADLGLRYGMSEVQQPDPVDAVKPGGGGGTVALRIGFGEMAVNSDIVPVDAGNKNVTPVLENSRTLVPVSRIVEAFGGKSGWEQSTRTATFTLDGHTVSTQIGSASVRVDGKTGTMDAPAQIINDRTYVPLRAVLEGLGLWVGYEPDNRLVVVSRNSLEGQNLKKVNQCRLLLAAEPFPDPIPGKISEEYTIDGHTYQMNVGDALTLFNSRQAVGDYYSYYWSVEEGEDLVLVDEDGPTCRFYAKRAGKVTIKSHLEETIVYWGSGSDHKTNEYTMTIEIVDSGASSGGLMSWQTCPACNGNKTIQVGGKQETCPTCLGQGKVLR